MKIGDIIAKIGELISAVEPESNNQPVAGMAPIIINTGSAPATTNDTPSPNGQTTSGNDKEPEDLFLPPLQQKQELLKKAVGVENVYDDGGPDEQHADEQKTEIEKLQAQQQDIVNRIRQLSGIPTAAIQELSNDDVFDD